MKFAAYMAFSFIPFYHVLLVPVFIILYMAVRLVRFLLILQIMYFYCYVDVLLLLCMFCPVYSFHWVRLSIVCLYSGVGKSLARSGRKQAIFPAFYGTWRFITTFTRVHHLSLP